LGGKLRQRGGIPLSLLSKKNHAVCFQLPQLPTFLTKENSQPGVAEHGGHIGRGWPMQPRGNAAKKKNLRIEIPHVKSELSLEQLFSVEHRDHHRWITA